MTIFAGYGKPFEPRMPQLERIAIRSFVAMVKTISKEDISGLA